MSFKEYLDKARKLGIDLGCAYIAQEVSEYEAAESIFDPEEFEKICSIVHNVWLNYQYSASEIVEVVMTLIQEEHIPLDEITDDKILKSL